MNPVEFFFLFLVFKVPTGGVEFRALEMPYYSADDCVKASGRILTAVKREHPEAVGALCYTIDEVSEFKYPIKRPL